MKLVISVIAMCLLLTAGPASAEWFADAYVGQSFTLKDDMTVHSPSGLSIYQDTEFDRSFIIGGRFGRYLNAVPFLGFGIDLSTYMPTIGPQQLHIDGCVPSGGCSGGQGGTTGRIDVDVITVSLDVLLRLPLLKSDKAPWGAIQPYITAGVPFSQITVTPANDGSVPQPGWRQRLHGRLQGRRRDRVPGRAEPHALRRVSLHALRGVGRFARLGDRQADAGPLQSRHTFRRPGVVSALVAGRERV
jgi:hypothetical protein